MQSNSGLVIARDEHQVAMLSILTSQESGELAQSGADRASDSDVQAAAAGAYKFFHGFSAQAFLSDRAVIIQGEATEIETD